VGGRPPVDGVTRPVRLTRSFYIMQTEVTQAEWTEVMKDEVPNTSWFAACGPQCPVVRITLWDTLVFANLRGALDGFEPCYELVGCTFDPVGHFWCEKAAAVGPDCSGYRIPSEAEWELAAGATSDKCMLTGPAYVYDDRTLCCSDLHFSYAWCRYHCEIHYEGCIPQDSGDQKCCGVHPVAQLAPNAFGLFDVIGNAEEFVATEKQDNKLPPPPLEVDPGQLAVIAGTVMDKGGTFKMEPPFLSPSVGLGRPTDSVNILTVAVPVGFRLVRTVPAGE